ncbi:RDD family protein [Mycobacterium sp. 050134]|uniref:RDD family protein n=1 Tax=Mycobacterium sp. 050134 TaxID=3096111 RepID=UPI002ED7C2C5
MSAVAEARPTTGPDDRESPADPAPWHARAGAFALDTLPGAMVLVTSTLVALAVPARGPWWWACVFSGTVATVCTAFNRWVLPAYTGGSFGRAVFGIRVMRRRNGDGIGPGRLLLRDAAHLLDTAALFVGWLWPLWDAQRRTFADMLLDTGARRTIARQRDQRLRGGAAALLVLSASVCGCGAAISYGVVREYDRSVADARAQVARQGPRMVEELLTYHPDSVQGDFDRASALATERYRPQLSAQQQAARRAGPVRNECWVTNSSVLTATPDRVTMLMFLQGERGDAPNERYLAASVRVTFVRPGTSAWRIDDFSVVSTSQPAGAKP